MNLASSRLLPVLRSVLEEDGYKEQMAREKYDCLRYKETFRRCLDAAYEQFNWTKKSFQAEGGEWDTRHFCGTSSSIQSARRTKKSFTGGSAGSCEPCTIG